MAIEILAYPYGWLFWAVFFFAYLPEFRLLAGSRPGKARVIDRGLTAVIMLAAWINFPLAFYTAGTGRFRLTHAGFGWPQESFCFWPGAACAATAGDCWDAISRIRS